MLFIFYTIITIIAFSACIDDTSAFVQDEESFVTINGIYTRELNNPELYPGDVEDDYVNTFRILAFDASTGQCKSNVLYFGAAVTSTIRHKISQGTYHFVFLANEPAYTDIANQLGAITTYNDIKKISYPEAVFTSDQDIPMIAENRNVSIQTDGTSLTANMRRLAVRLEVKLKAKLTDDLNAAFKGITLSNIPDRVPLIWGLPSERISGSSEYPVPTLTDYVGTAVAQDKTRTYDATEFTDALTATDQADGYIWAKKLERVIIPSNYFADREEEASGVILTVKMVVDKYSPSCTLKIYSEPSAVDYRLPANSKLDFLGIIKEPLEMNITYKPWWTVNEDWNIDGSRILNVSQTSASITDLNGVRISFWSNMPRVRILSTVVKQGTGNMSTNLVFNDLAVADGSNTTTRFSYDPTTGSGHVDILVDGDKNKLIAGSQSGTYILTLSADDGNGNNILERTITINVTQNGIRFAQGNWDGSSQYAAVFFRNNQRGERIITGQHLLEKKWTATVPAAYRDWIVISSVPSFDPGAGTDQPGDAEQYPVIPDSYKSENGYIVTGTGRIYFRIGMKKNNDNPMDDDGLRKPKYGVVELKFFASSTWEFTQKIYVRQGEDPDYLFEYDDDIELTSAVDAKFQSLAGQKRTAAARFSPYNLTASEFNKEANDNFIQLPYKGGAFTEYPSQGGALFQWGLRLMDDPAVNVPVKKFYRRAFNPYGNVKNSTSWISTKGYNKTLLLPAGYPASWYVMWGAIAEGALQPHGEVFETCPVGYHRSTDGLTTEIMTNGPTPKDEENANLRSQIKDSELRTSLFTYPFSGDANSNSDLTTIWTTESGTYPTVEKGYKSVANTYRSFYADGFFDRRPIKDADSGGLGVAIGTARVAYMGLLFVNPKTNASLFFPSAGRISNDWADFQTRGKTGYYWSSSAAPSRGGGEYTKENYPKPGENSDRRITNGAWSMEVQYDYLLFRNTYADYGQSIRCVKDDPKP